MIESIKFTWFLICLPYQVFLGKGPSKGSGIAAAIGELSELVMVTLSGLFQFIIFLIIVVSIYFIC